MMADKHGHVPLLRRAQRIRVPLDLGQSCAGGSELHDLRRMSHLLVASQR